MDDLESIRARIRGLARKRWPELSKLANVPYSTLTKFAYGYVADPTFTTVSNLVEALDKMPPEEAAA